MDWYTIPKTNTPEAFTVTRANGASFSQTATTEADSTAGYTFRLKKNDLLGPYQVTTTASVNGFTGSAGTSFAVQK